MRAVVTRVSSASVTIDGAVRGAIEKGYLVLLGVGPQDTEAVCDKLAEKICKNAQKAIRASKLAIRRGMDCDISTAVSYEALAFATCFGTEDQKEGMQAFLEKRKEKHFKNA